MPLRDHFRSPLDDVTAWEGFHGQWPAVIVQQLGKKLPARYVAAPRVHSGSHVEIDVATYDTEDAGASAPEASANNGGYQGLPGIGLFMGKDNNKPTIRLQSFMTGLECTKHTIFIVCFRLLSVTIKAASLINEFTVFTLMIPFRGGW